MPVLCVPSVSEAQSAAARAALAQRHAGEGGFCVGMTRTRRPPPIAHVSNWFQSNVDNVSLLTYYLLSYAIVYVTNWSIRVGSLLFCMTGRHKDYFDNGS